MTFPLLDLRITTPNLELRLPDEEQLEALGTVAGEGIHDPGNLPFNVPWTDGTPEEVARNVVTFYWGQLSRITPQRWSLPFAVLKDGVVVGKQDIGGEDFAITRETGTGSWLGRRFQGKGIGTEMRAAVLHLAFAGLGAEWATSAAYVDNPSSLRVSQKLGYTEDGLRVMAVQGRRRYMTGLRLTRENWERHRAVPVEIHGLEPCLPLLGL